jgi:hypothetical protein
MHEAASRALFVASLRTVTPELCALRGWTLHAVEFPLVDVAFTAPGRKTLRLRVMCDDWGSTPASFVLCAEDGSFLVTPPSAPAGQFNAGPHPATGRPFICMRGVREYHTHGSHVGDPWSNYRDLPEFTLSSVITQVWNAWLKATP